MGKWNGSGTYAEKFRDPQWQKKRLEIMERDSFTCQRCSSSDKTLNVHHSFYEKGKLPWEYPAYSLHTLCEDCHEVVQEQMTILHRAIGLLTFEQMEEITGYAYGLSVMDTMQNNTPSTVHVCSAPQVDGFVRSIMTHNGPGASKPFNAAANRVADFLMDNPGLPIGFVRAFELCYKSNHSKQAPCSSVASTPSERREALSVIRNEVSSCNACSLANCRTQTVFGAGAVNPRVVFFGEAPGAEEDKQGEPFVGRSGRKLDEIIEACTFRREDVYILNVLKCRPPDNRPPEPEEVANCRHFFERQLDVLKPEYIVCLGASAAQAMFETTDSIGKLRGRFHTYRNSKVIATYHPSYLLRNPAASKYVWEDMKIILSDMGITPSEPIPQP